MALYRDRFQIDKEELTFDELFKDREFSKALGDERDKNIKPVINFMSEKMNLGRILFCDIGAGYGSLSIPLAMVGARGIAGDNSEYIQTRLLKEIYRVLKKGGYLYLATENRFAANYFAFGRGHDGLFFSSIMPRCLAKIYSKIVKKQDYYM